MPMNTTPPPDDPDDCGFEDAYEIVQSMTQRNIDNIRYPDGQTIAIDWTEPGGQRYRLEVNLLRGYIWVHHMTPTGDERFVTLWQNKGPSRR